MKAILQMGLHLTLFHDHGGKSPLVISQNGRDELLTMTFPVLSGAEADEIMPFLQKPNSQIGDRLGELAGLVRPDNGEDVILGALWSEGEIAGFVSEEMERGQ